MTVAPETGRAGSLTPCARHRSAEVTLLLIAAIWGTTFALLRDVMRVLHPFDVMALRFSIAAVIVALICAPRLGRMRRIWLWDGVRTGVFLAVGYLTQVLGLQTTASARSAFITSMALVFVPFAAYAIQRARTGIGETIGVVLAASGLILFYADVGLSFRSGDLWTLGCAVAFAIQIVYTNIAAKRSDPIVVSAIQMIVAAAFGWVLVLGRGGLAIPIVAIPWAKLLYLAVIATALIVALQTWALGRVDPVRAAILFTTEPIFAAIFAAAAYGEGMTSRERVIGNASRHMGDDLPTLYREICGIQARCLARVFDLGRA